jgi:hypothetical protein
MTWPIEEIFRERMQAAPATVSILLEGADLIDIGYVTEPRAAVFAMRVLEEYVLIAAIAVKGLHRVVGGNVMARRFVRALSAMLSQTSCRNQAVFSMTNRDRVAARAACAASIEQRSPVCPFVSR